MLPLLASLAFGACLDNFAETDDIGSHKVPHRGTSHILVVPIDVGDGWSPPMARLREDFGENGSFRQFWKEQSNGLYDPIPFVAEPLVFTECPIAVTGDCTLDATDITLLSTSAVPDALSVLLGRLRDEQGLDLSDFDVNGADGQPDGYLDGVVFYTSMADGVMFPFIAFGLEATVPASSPDDPETVTLSLGAFAPPDHHEFAHLFGLIDLYNGPNPGSLMSSSRATHLSAYNRVGLGWSEEQVVTASRELSLRPDLAGGRMLRIGSGPQFLMIANQEGGLRVTSVDERALPEGPHGFLDIGNRDLYYPNSEEPWLNRLMPEHDPEEDLVAAGDSLALAHASEGGPTGWTVEVLEVDSDGTMRIRLVDPDGSAPEIESEQPGTCDTGGTTTGWPLIFAALVPGLRRRR